jgi:hypothetical protein
MKTSVLLGGLLFALCSAGLMAQNADPGLQGNWKYLRNFTYVYIDDQDRAFQCRVMPDLNVYLATGFLSEGFVHWQPVRFFNRYGRELSPSWQEWGRNNIELRTRIMFMTAPSPSGQSQERMEFDKVAQLPTICSHYLAMASD